LAVAAHAALGAVAARAAVGATAAALALAGAFTPASSAQPTGWYPAVGASWVVPLESSVSDLYGSGPGLAFGGGYAWSPRWRAEVQLGWYRLSGEPEAALAEDTEGELTLLPFHAEVRMAPARLETAWGLLAPWVGAGPALVFSHETLTYTLFGQTHEETGKRSDFGGTAAAGIELRRGRWTVGAQARALLAGGHREVLRANGDTDERDDTATPSHLTFGLETRIALP